MSGNKFFSFFLKKRLKLGLSAIIALIGVLSNYYAIVFSVKELRPDISSIMTPIYSIGLTAMLEFCIILFHLMHIRILYTGSTIAVIIIGIFANLNVILSNSFTSFSKLIGSVLIGLTFAILPIMILTYLMSLLTKQIENESSGTIGTQKKVVNLSSKDF